MWTEKDIDVIHWGVAELISELNYKHFAVIAGRNNARKLESHGYVELKGKRHNNGDIEITIHFRDFSDSSQELDKLMSGYALKGE